MLLTNKIRRYKNSTAHERGLIMRTLLWLWFFRLRDLTLPYWLTRKWISEEVAEKPAQGLANDALIVEVTSTIRKCKRYVPGATCLTKALAARAILRHYGQTACIRIGVAKADTLIDAHAWVEVDGRIVFGRQPNWARYSVMHRPSIS